MEEKMRTRLWLGIGSLILITMFVVALLIESYASQSSTTMTNVMITNAYATNIMIQRTLFAPQTRPTLTSTVLPELIDTANAQNATNAAAATQSWINVTLTAQASQSLRSP
jgi:hypothetical protein